MPLSFKVGTFVNDLVDGSQAVTGVGFQPKALMLVTVSTTADTFQADSTLYLGFASSASGADQKSFSFYGFDESDPSDVDSAFDANSVWHEQDFPNIGQQGTISSLDSDGFTITWSNSAASPIAWRIKYIAIGGTDVTNAEVGQFNAPAATGNSSITGVGFQPECVILLGTNHTSDNTLTDDFGTYSLGFASAAGEMGVMSGIIKNGVDTMSTARYQRTDKCLAMFAVSDPTTLTHEATLASFDSDGFSLNYTTASASGKRVAYLAIRGGSFKVGSFTSPTVGALPVSQSTTGVGFQPNGIIFLTAGETASSSIQSHMRACIGSANSGASRFSCWTGDEDGATVQVTSTREDTGEVIRVSDEAILSADTTTQALADLTSFDSDGFTLSWSARNTANAYQIIYMAFGDAAMVEPETQVSQRRGIALTLADPFIEDVSYHQSRRISRHIHTQM